MLVYFHCIFVRIRTLLYWQELIRGWWVRETLLKVDLYDFCFSIWYWCKCTCNFVLLKWMSVDVGDRLFSIGVLVALVFGREIRVEAFPQHLKWPELHIQYQQKKYCKLGKILHKCCPNYLSTFYNTGLFHLISEETCLPELV